MKRLRKKTKSFHWGIVLHEDDKVIGEAWVSFVGRKGFEKFIHDLPKW